MEDVVAKPALTGARKPTQAEIEFYCEHGWAKLSGLFPVELARGLLAIAKLHMGENAESDGYTSRGSLYAAWPRASWENDWLRSVSHSQEVASVVRGLCGGRPLRYYNDLFMAKRPAQDGGTRTPWHQDLPNQPFDRGGAITLWMPLVDCPPERGSLRFLSGSRAGGPLGRFGAREDGIDMVDAYPHVIDEYELSPPLSLSVGDVTVHDFLTIHSAPDNLMNETRWVYAMTFFPAETLYTGADSRNTNGLNLTVNQTFDDGLFPILGVSAQVGPAASAPGDGAPCPSNRDNQPQGK